MGVDSMIHLAVRARRLRIAGIAPADAWFEARAQLWRPIVGASLIICAGFGIFGLSAFPPTQRFGLAVILGTVTAATLTLIAVPLGAVGRR
jgi:predicted RND superfamily exporter protein